MSEIPHIEGEKVEKDDFLERREAWQAARVFTDLLNTMLMEGEESGETGPTGQGSTTFRTRLERFGAIDTTDDGRITPLHLTLAISQALEKLTPRP